MANISDLEPLARPYIQDCPKLLVTRELLRAARTFFAESQVWREIVFVGIGGGLNSGQLNIEDGQAMIAIADVRKMGDTKSLLKTPDKRNLPTYTGEPGVYTATTDALYIGPIPAETYIAEVEVIVKPSLNATTLPDVTLEDWGEQIACGAVESLLNMPDTTWFNPQASIGHGNRFRTGITEARIRVSQGFSNASPRASGGKFI
jgi:hypothetical protein